MKKNFLFLLLPLFTAFFMQAQESLPSLSKAERVYGLSKFWSEVKYNFVYYDELKFDWDSLYMEYLPLVEAEEDFIAYYDLLRSFCARLQDGHTNVYYPSKVYEHIGRPPLRTQLIEGKVIVTEIRNDTLREAGIQIGMEVVNINGMNAVAYGEKYIAPYVSASTPQDRVNRMYNYEYFMGPKDEPITLELKDKNGKISKQEISRTMTSQSNFPTLTFKVLENNIGHLTVNSFGQNDFWDAFNETYPEILKTNGLVIDIRNNGGGNSNQGYYIVRHLSSKPFKGSRVAIKQYLPSFKAWGWNPTWFVEEAGLQQPIQDKEIYTKPVVVLISERTFSAAEDFCVAFDGADRGLFIGSASGGSTGQPLFIDLPGGGRGRMCSKKDTYPDGTPFVGVGIQPDIEIHPTIKSIQQGEDPVLNKALESLKK